MFALLFLHLLSGSAFTAGFNLAKDQEGKQGPLVITSGTLEIDNEKKTVTFTEKVNAKIDDWVMDCSKMVLFYDQETAKGATKSEKMRVDKIIATGDVRILRSAGGEAAAEEAVFYQADEKIILTGNPVVRQGEDFVEGSRITLFLKENRSVVEGSKEQKARAVIMPRSEAR
ncbi:MAG: hypothetical protein JW836_16895 [Deltaproteobacteria bacterium]|nr:hypothetical protein [Deltaproteobacteria bacterium]